MKVKVTRQWLGSVSTSGFSGWTREQLRLLGVEWPPAAGWARRIEGLLISSETAQRIEALGQASREKKRI